jgi:hypothetical protein
VVVDRMWEHSVPWQQAWAEGRPVTIGRHCTEGRQSTRTTGSHKETRRQRAACMPRRSAHLVYVHVRLCVCVCVCMYVCMYVCTYLCIHVCMCVVSVCVCAHLRCAKCQKRPNSRSLLPLIKRQETVRFNG